MAERIDWDAFGTHVRRKRVLKGLGLRQNAALIGIDKATLSRVENNKPCEVGAFLILCRWMRRNPTSYLTKEAPRHE